MKIVINTKETLPKNKTIVKSKTVKISEKRLKHLITLQNDDLKETQNASF